jgi:hypothetical protein
MALVVVMGTAAIAAVMAAHVMLLSETVARESAVAAERQALRYAAESAADRAFWRHLVDRRLYADRTLGVPSAEREAKQAEAWMMDGRPHRIEGTTCTVRLYDALQGISFAGNQPGQELREQGDPEDNEQREAIDTFLDIVADYVDPDDQTHLRGMERGGYEAEGWPGLPRDAPLQFREEIYWLPGWREVLYGPVQIIPPPGINTAPRQGAASKPPFFSSAPALIQRVLRCSDAERELILAARAACVQDGMTLDVSLNDPELLGRIRSSFSLTESVAVSVVVDAVSASGIAGRLSVTRISDLSRPDAYSDSARQAWALWCRQWE